MIASSAYSVRSGRAATRSSNNPLDGEHPLFLSPAVKRFLKAAEADLSDDEALHDLRIQAKKLRYSMEHVAAAFKPSFKNKLYVRDFVAAGLDGRGE